MLFYGCKTWILRDDSERRIQTFENKEVDNEHENIIFTKHGRHSYSTRNQYSQQSSGLVRSRDLTRHFVIDYHPRYLGRGWTLRWPEEELAYDREGLVVSCRTCSPLPDRCEGRTFSSIIYAHANDLEEGISDERNNMQRVGWS